MNARVLLLVLITGLFMAAWEGDQAAMRAAIVKRTQQRTTAVAAVQPTVDDDGMEVVIPSHSLTVLKIDESRPAASGQIDVPLPPGIAAGQYQAVNQFGQTRLMEVSAREATGQNVRDFHLVDAKDGSRWYLIRIEGR
ncbi:MAG: hypothetical protein GY903_23345 [Fuerstiella sp.]|nr:hypothetical protein [Fuerstiella sp.]MCP4784471.1 hypothetical protein [Fuerstiella sp.]MCP4857430.1 hypothetical protein [Fuerstiella sp.]